MNRTDLSSKPSLTQGLPLELPLKKADDFLELALLLTLIVLESLSCIKSLIDVSLEEVIP
jgi:hypothetical protein